MRQLWESAQGRAFLFLEERRGGGLRQQVPQVLLEAGQIRERGCPLKGGVGTPRGEFRRRSSGGRRRENGCRAVELLSPDEADRPGYRGVSKASRGPQGDPNA